MEELAINERVPEEDKWTTLAPKTIYGGDDDNSPMLLRLFDRVCHDSQKKKQKGQLLQTKMMICHHHEHLKEQWAGVGAVVVVTID